MLICNKIIVEGVINELQLQLFLKQVIPQPAGIKFSGFLKPMITLHTMLSVIWQFKSIYSPGLYVCLMKILLMVMMMIMTPLIYTMLMIMTPLIYTMLIADDIDRNIHLQI